MRSMHIVTRQGVVKVGFDAVRGLGARLPLFWLPTAIADRSRGSHRLGALYTID